MNKQNDGFKIPDNYFKNFEEQLSKKVLKDSSKSKVKTMYYKYAIAASLALLISLSYFLIKNNTSIIKPSTLVNTHSTNNDELLAAFIDDEYIDEYLDEYLIDSINEN